MFFRSIDLLSFLNRASFHPLSNRKHHCRLCGRIICSLPVKYLQRKHLCSTLFVVDQQTRQIEEVGEGVDYGVRKRRVSGVAGPNSKQEEDLKFLQGVRICHDCRPTLLCVIVFLHCWSIFQNLTGSSSTSSRHNLSLLL